MSVEKLNIPQADMLMGSMRSMGYSFEAAIADVIDNSVTAYCTEVKILFPRTPLDYIAVGILDNGHGMTDIELFEAMRYGSSSEDEREENDLGRFGLGLKSASMSQCRILTAISKTSDSTFVAYSWDFNYIKKKKNWIVKKLSLKEIKEVPYFSLFSSYNEGTLIVWQDFDFISKASGGMVYEMLNKLKDKVGKYCSLIFHRFLEKKSPKHIDIWINNEELKPLDPFLENHPKTTRKKERIIAIEDSSGVERQISIRPFVLPFLSDLTDKDKKLMGGIEKMRAMQGFYIYRNMRLIIWGTWFNMKLRGELTKYARIRVDIPNSLDDIWRIDIKKQNAVIPQRILNQLNSTILEAMDISEKKETHRGRKQKVDEKIDYIWDRMEGRNEHFYYQINRESRLYHYVKDNMDENSFQLMEILLNEIEHNIPTQQMYIDRANDVIEDVQEDNRVDDIFQLSITMVDNLINISHMTPDEAIKSIQYSEPFVKFPTIFDKLNEYYSNIDD